MVSVPPPKLQFQDTIVSLAMPAAEVSVNVKACPTQIVGIENPAIGFLPMVIVIESCTAKHCPLPVEVRVIITMPVSLLPGR